jgi:hypothetical protein
MPTTSHPLPLPSHPPTPLPLLAQAQEPSLSPTLPRGPLLPLVRPPSSLPVPLHFLAYPPSNPLPLSPLSLSHSLSLPLSHAHTHHSQCDRGRHRERAGPAQVSPSALHRPQSLEELESRRRRRRASTRTCRQRKVSISELRTHPRIGIITLSQIHPYSCPAGKCSRPSQQSRPGHLPLLPRKSQQGRRNT